MQASIQNPLADPYIIGTSTGASLGATVVVWLGVINNVSWAKGLSIGAGAFVGAMVASFLVLAIANSGGRMTSIKLVLGGAVLNMVFGSFSSMIFQLHPGDQRLQNVSYFLTGSLSVITWKSFGFIPIIIIAAIIFFLLQTRILNVMMLGDESATTVGVDTTRYRLVFMIVASLITGIIVATCGIVGYVGLIIPHIARGLVGTNHRKMLPFSICLGAVFLIWCDVFARTIIVHGELPLGLVTATIGAPLLLYRIVRQGFGPSPN
jgi:iron complex transport system permease protein